MESAELRPINLTILHEEALLSFSLTDGRSVGRFGRVEFAPGMLDRLGPHGAPARELGGTIFALLPEAIRSFLVQSPPRCLYLQLSESLIGIPWESAFGGTTFLGEKFAISRQIVGDEEIAAPAPARPAREQLKLLIIDAGADSRQQQAYPASLLQRLAALPKFSAQRVNAGALGRDAILQLIGDSDIVHYVGDAGGRASAGGDIEWWQGDDSVTVRGIAALPFPPRLLVSEFAGEEPSGFAPSAANNALAVAACRHGLNLLIRDSTPGSGEFMQEIYRELARGASLGDAARRAAVLARRNAGTGDAAWPQAALYGDCALVPHLQSGRQRDDLRQVTIMSHDLVDSTRLLARLGAEKYSELLAGYHRRCADIVAKHGGVSDDPQGDDGIMCYFGVPVAREDAAARALRAGLEIAAAIADFGVSVRIGIVTAPVVVTAGQPVGVGIHLAARLQSIAESGTIVVSDSTRQIVKDRFEFQRLDQVAQLKGFDRPGAVYRLLGETPGGGTGRFDAGPGLTPFVGRETELKLLRDHWAAASKRALRTVLVTGEAGIGKSRLVREFRHSVALSASQSIEARCAPDHSGSAFHPVIEFLRRLLQIHDGDNADSRLDKIAGALAPEVEIAGAVQLIAALLSVPFEPRYAPLDYPAEKRRQLTLHTLVRWICREAGKAPVCLIVEDVHWVDPSTMEFLKRLIAAAARLPLFVLLTCRSDAMQTPASPVAAYAVELKGLSLDSTRAMIRGACGEARITDEIARMLADKTDGVPLFVAPGVMASSNNVTGVVYYPGQAGVGWNYWEWTKK